MELPVAQLSLSQEARTTGRFGKSPPADRAVVVRVGVAAEQDPRMPIAYMRTAGSQGRRLCTTPLTSANRADSRSNPESVSELWHHTVAPQKLLVTAPSP